MTYTSTGRLDETSVRPHIVRAWRRSVEGGCDPHIMRADQLDVIGTAALLEHEKTLIESARPFMLALSRAAGTDRHAAMLGDADGRVLDVVGDEPSVRGPESVPGPGSLLSEANAGANGIGSTLGQGGYVERVGPEHFIEGFHPFTCQGVPLIGVSGHVTGVLSTSVRRLETATRLRDILFCAAQAVECDLLSRWLLDAVVKAGPRAGFLEALRQDAVQRFSAARLHLESAAKEISRGGTATRIVNTAEGLIERFRKVAATWQDLVLEVPGQNELLNLPDLVDRLLDLLETEARLDAIELVWGRAEPMVVLEERRAFTRLLLEKLLDAMQAAGQGGRVRVEVMMGEREQPTVFLSSRGAADGGDVTWTVSATAGPT
jgi:transcriptional regulator of acetoin/glycerol metabolism